MYINNLNISEPLKRTEDIEKIDFFDSSEKEFFENNKPYKSYEDSWYALIQGIRNNPRVYKRKLYFSDHPYKSNSIVVYNHLCHSVSEFSKLLYSLINELDKAEAVWKNADPKDMISLLHFGFECYKDGETWDSLSKYDDQTYGQNICLLKEISLLKGSKFGQIRQQTRAVERNYNNELLIEPYNRKYQAECEKLALDLEQHMVNENMSSIKNVVLANVLYLSYPPNNSYLVRHKEEILSFIAFDIREETANFNCLLYKRESKYMSTYSMVKAAQEFYKNGVRLLNLSGSEIKSLDKWKKKFNPIKAIDRIHMTLVRKNTYELN